jgi:hypothetical protein
VELFGNAGRWVAFAAAAIGMSWFLRLVAARAAARGSRLLGDAREALGLSRAIPARFIVRGRSREAKDVERDGRVG